MTVELSAMEKAGRCHGDIAPWNVLLTAAGDPVLLNAGLRRILRPEEGFAFAELLPEAYDYLAPERVTAGVPPGTASDIYACGCVWWQMLCGRPPLLGGDSLTKLRTVPTVEIPNARQLAPETPAVLAEAIAACVLKDPIRRPASFAKLAAMLGPPEKGSPQFIARTIAADARPGRWGDCLNRKRAACAQLADCRDGPRRLPLGGAATVGADLSGVDGEIEFPENGCKIASNGNQFRCKERTG